MSIYRCIKVGQMKSKQAFSKTREAVMFQCSWTTRIPNGLRESFVHGGRMKCGIEHTPKTTKINQREHELY